MPRFLNTWTGRFEWSNRPDTVRYAILSHTWRSPEDGGEQSYEDILKLQAEVSGSQTNTSVSVPLSPPALRSDDSSNSEDSSDFELEVYAANSAMPRVISAFFSHPKLSNKIAMACKLAREDGYERLWIDACCIDKTSSAELAEAINSMYEWYRLSDVCYAFLADVADDSKSPRERYSSFWWSRWHKRGWTLQELIAPERVVFLTRTWSVLGTKMGFATTLEEITGVDFDILVGAARVDSVSVARRMSWAAKRQTTRAEDRAYSLLGIFGVHMAPIYGEGMNALQRLQEEILKTVPDQTIFAWTCLESIPGLLPTYLYFFDHSANFRVTSPTDFASRLRLRTQDVPPLHAVVTPQGIRIKLLCVDLFKFQDISKSIPELVPDKYSASCEECMQLPGAHLLALLQCQHRDGRLIALPLSYPPQGPGAEKGLHVADFGRCARHRWALAQSHIICLQEIHLSRILAARSLSVVEVSILRHHSFSVDSKYSLGSNRLEFWNKTKQDAVHFELDSRSIQELYMLGFHLSPPQLAQSPDNKVVSFALFSNSVHRPRTADLPRQKVSISLSFTPRDEYYVNTNVVFSATNFTFGPRQHSSISPPFMCAETNTSGEPFDLPPSVILDTTSGAYLAEGVSTAHFQLSHHNYAGPYVLACAQFAIYVGPPGESDVDDQALPIRWLRILLQRSIEHRDDRLSIAVELSDVGKYTRPDNCTTSQRIDMPTSGREGAVDPGELSSSLVPQPTVQTLSETVETLRSQLDALLSQQAVLAAPTVATMLEQPRPPIPVSTRSHSEAVQLPGDSSRPSETMHVESLKVPMVERTSDAPSLKQTGLDAVVPLEPAAARAPADVSPQSSSSSAFRECTGPFRVRRSIKQFLKRVSAGWRRRTLP
ncbi:heterokaryon incompatibility protein-domain-containing protein [Lenzites betulinus]|nr:heterokaryon incompatibility protein-domain-containing protein [Lenzites betulinus]